MRRKAAQPAALDPALFAGLRMPALVGVSGGMDSVVLLDALVHAGFRDLVACHLDHGLRPESEEDAWFVAELASRHELAFECMRVDVAAIALQSGLSIETAARKARLRFFAHAARVHCCPRVLLAHHADDQAETFLFNLLRGSGRSGLCGMRPRSSVEMDGVRLELLRPLLTVWREDLARIAAARGLGWRDDPSNASLEHCRNRIRHKVIPQLNEAMGRDVRAALLRTAELFTGEEDFLVSATPGIPEGPLPLGPLRELPIALQRRWILAWLRAQGLSEIGYEEVEAVRRLGETERPAKVNIAGGHHVRRRAGRIFLEESKPRSATAGERPE
jgi:tRNA(Ile)-lysidine synthase